MDKKEFYNSEELMGLLGISKPTFRILIEKGVFTPLKGPRRKHIFPRYQIDEFANQNKKKETNASQEKKNS